MAGARSRGQPLLVLAVLISGWIGARAVAWNLLPGSAEVATVSPLAPVAPTAALLAPAAMRAAPPAKPRWAPAPAPAHLLPLPVAMPPRWQPAPPPPGLLALLPAPAVAAPAPDPASAPPPGATPQMVAAGGHQLLWMAAAALLPLPAEVAGHFAAAPPRPAGKTVLPRWSADGWLFLRQGAPNPITFPRLTTGGSYGASQAGAVLRYRLAPADPHRPALYLRGSGALNGTREQDVALGFSARPIAGLAVAAMAEVRATRDGLGTRARPAVAVVTELPPQQLPLRFTAEAYAQAGYVGGRAATAYVDGLIRAERPVATIAGADVNAGGGIWGAKQKGAERLDVGPVASVRLRLGDTASARLEADWRFRVAGNAHPGSGPALTLSAGF